MPIPVTCPACATAFRLAKNLCGRKMFCPACGQSLVVSPAGAASREAGNSTAEPAPKPSRSGNSVVLAVAAVFVVGALAVASVGIVGGGITAAYYGFYRDDPKPIPLRIEDHRWHEHFDKDAPPNRERPDDRNMRPDSSERGRMDRARSDARSFHSNGPSDREHQDDRCESKS
jgi:hypothetical protein